MARLSHTERAAILAHELSHLARRDNVTAVIHMLVEALFWQPNPMPVKAALNLLGFDVGKPRLPLVDLTDAEKDRLRAVLDRYTGDFDPFLSKQLVAA